MEERKERNAYYERERRQVTAAALRDLADANGLDSSANQMVILSRAVEFIKRKQKEKATGISLEDMRRQNQSLEKQIADCHARLGAKLPSNAAVAKNPKNIVKAEPPEVLPEKILNDLPNLDWLEEWRAELPEGLFDDLLMGYSPDLFNEGSKQEGLLELPIKVPKAKKPRVGRAGQAPTQFDTPPRTDSSSRPSFKDSAKHRKKDAAPAMPQRKRILRLQMPSAAAAAPPTEVRRIKDCALMNIFTDTEKTYNIVQEYMGVMRADCDGSNCKCQLYPRPDT